MSNPSVQMCVGLRIKELRSAQGVSQEAFANAIGMSRSYLAEVETGKRNVSIKNIERICKGLNTTVRVFFDSDFFD